MTIHMTVINSGADRYAILSRLRGDRRRLTARGGTGGEYLLVIIDDPARARAMAPAFLGYRENAAFTDLQEVFPYGDGLCAVFSHRDAARMRPAETVLAGAPPAERAAVLRALFTRILSQEPPWPVLRDVLRPENLLCSSAGEIGFIYDLHPDCGGDGPEYAMAALTAAVRNICGDAGLPALEALYGELSGPPYDRAALYAAALEAADALAACCPATKQARSTLRERAGAALDALPGHFAPIFIWLALAVGYILAGLLFYHMVIAPAPVDNGLSVIGRGGQANETEQPA